MFRASGIRSRAAGFIVDSQKRRACASWRLLGMICDESMMHGRPWRGEDVCGWLASEKLDGCRGYWDGARMWSRSGRVIPIPSQWAAGLPRMHLDGEIWAGRGKWETTVAAVVRNQWAPDVGFFVFDAPQIPGTWRERITAAAKRVRCGFAAVVPWVAVRDLEHARQLFRGIRLDGGEGLMLRNPRVRGYAPRRAAYVLKMKRDPITGELAWQERRYAA